MNVENVLRAAVAAVLDQNIRIYFKRPKSTDKDVTEMIVVDAPSSIYNKEIGGVKGGFGYEYTAVTYEIFVKDASKPSEKTEENVKRLSAIINNIMNKFPYKNTTYGMLLKDAQVMFAAKDDGLGWSSGRIDVTATTMF